ncbi:hypothetical protein PCASD_01098 [Puccinia coronata f. sp. avenae]|uniref:Glycoside hydrolase 131 catalytic N-terminal domain-containing protein n=1 Tax=Puccinia coronata f. sp. avenae TaxID=200324 RepID=A0A2N5VLJ6_9BASI|nr:hypothetical protein PCASD_01098 [Puccinia coronata f. sp. avenae]
MAALFEAHYRVPLNAKVADIDNPGSALGKLTQFKIIGSNTVNDAYEFQKTPNGKFQSITFKINDNSIFKPDKNPKDDQVGFRRNDLLPKYDAKAIETKKRTYHHSFIFKKDLDKKHGYLLASVEFPKAETCVTCIRAVKSEAAVCTRDPLLNDLSARIEKNPAQLRASPPREVNRVAIRVLATQTRKSPPTGGAV